MAGAVLFTDLDGTLIFSAARRTEGDVIVERKNGEPISCISAYQQSVLPSLENVVPVTTRSIEQYRRIKFPEGFSPKFALTDNGGNLLIDGVPDPEWAEWGRGLSRECETELSRAQALLETDPDRSFEIRRVDGLFLFTKSGNPEETVSRLGAGELCESFFTGQKVYVIPKALSKGAAVKRFRERFRGFGGDTLCAGDSRMDIPLLNAADIALFPDSIPESEVIAPKKLTHPREGFTDFVTKTFFEFQQR